jgi:general secretion pathway protein J
MTGLQRGKSQSWWYATVGMTLIEMLVALAIFAVLGIMGYRAAATAMDSRQRVAAEMLRWRDIANLMQIVETDLTQFVERPTVATTSESGNGLVLASSVSGSQLSFLKVDGGGASVRRRGYRIDGRRVLQLRWPGTDPVSNPESHVVLENVAALRCTIMTSDGKRYADWPPSALGQTVKPAAVEIEMELPDAGTIRRLIAIR